MPLIYSFDVFDTALVRRVALPTDIFRLVARELSTGLDAAALTEFEESFLSARIAAERIARANAAPQEDCTLPVIWHELRRLMPSLADEATDDVEVRVERANIVGNPGLSAHIRALQSAGERVIFVSDIFHTRETVFTLLNDAGLASRIDQVYVSSEIALLKSSGRLFHHVAAAEGVSTSDIAHIGDHAVSDGSAARARGVRATLYPATRLNGAEQVVLAAFGNDMAGSRLAAAMRLARLGDRPDGRGTLVSAYLGPMAVLQATWCLRHAGQRQAARVYFVARDGYVPWRAAVELTRAATTVECRYIKLSRQSLIAAMPQLGEFGVFWIERSWAKLSLGQIASLLGHEWDDIAEATIRLIPHAGRDYLLPSTEEMRYFVRVLDEAPTEDEPARQRATRRAAALDYMRSQGLFDDEPFLLFDVGWYLNMQAAVKKVVEQQGGGGFLGGLYLGLCHGRVNEALSGPARALVYEKPYSPDLPPGSNIVFDRIILIEHLMGLAPLGSAKGYVSDGDDVAVTEGPITETRRQTVERISDDVAAFAALLAPYAQELGGEDASRRALASLTEHFMTCPASYDLSALDDLQVERDAADEPVMAMAEPWRLSSVALQAVPYRLRVRMKLSGGPTLWPEASVANSSLVSRVAIRATRGARRVVGRLRRR